MNKCSQDSTQQKPHLQNKLIKSENSTQYTRWFCVCVCVSYTLCSAKGMWKKVLFLHNWLKINSWHYLHLPKSTAQPSAPSPEVAGQAMERKIPTVKYVVDWNSQEFEQLFLGNQSIIFNNYWITTLFHISLLQLNQGLLFYCFY